MGVAMAALGAMWQTISQREKERELLFIGSQYHQAIKSFWNAPAGGVRRLPKDFKELLADPRFPNTVRHLRRVYRDPMTGSYDWGMRKEPEGGFSAVFSLSEAKPIKTANFPPDFLDFEEAKTYKDWQFSFDHAKANKESLSAQAVRPSKRIPLPEASLQE
jgi:type II secretory pathway pseudopilin PulG